MAEKQVLVYGVPDSPLVCAPGRRNRRASPGSPRPDGCWHRDRAASRHSPTCTALSQTTLIPGPPDGFVSSPLTGRGRFFNQRAAGDSRCGLQHVSRTGGQRHDHRAQQAGSASNDEGRHPDNGLRGPLYCVLEVARPKGAGDAGDAVSGEYPAIVAADVPVTEEIGGGRGEQRKSASWCKSRSNCDRNLTSLSWIKQHHGARRSFRSGCG